MSIFTITHYKAIAAEFKAFSPWTEVAARSEWRTTVNGIARMLKRDNADFDFCRFFVACGFTIGELNQYVTDDLYHANAINGTIREYCTTR